MATTSKRRTASKTAKHTGKREIRMPSRFSKDYPVHDAGHGYLIRSIPDPLWDRVIKRADAEDLSVRFICIRLLEMYADHEVGPLGEPTVRPYSPEPTRRRRR